jgi:hypothetical protein
MNKKYGENKSDYIHSFEDSFNESVQKDVENLIIKIEDN